MPVAFNGIRSLRRLNGKNVFAVHPGCTIVPLGEHKDNS